MTSPDLRISLTLDEARQLFHMARRGGPTTAAEADTLSDLHSTLADAETLSDLCSALVDPDTLRDLCHALADDDGQTPAAPAPTPAEVRPVTLASLGRVAPRARAEDRPVTAPVWTTVEIRDLPAGWHAVSAESVVPVDLVVRQELRVGPEPHAVRFLPGIVVDDETLDVAFGYPNDAPPYLVVPPDGDVDAARRFLAGREQALRAAAIEPEDDPQAPEAVLRGEDRPEPSAAADGGPSSNRRLDADRWRLDRRRGDPLVRAG